MPRDLSPNARLRAARQRMSSPSGSGQLMSRQELADAINAYLWSTYHEVGHLDRTDIGKLERGAHLWPSVRRREAFRAVLGASNDADLGFSGNRGRRVVQDISDHDFLAQLPAQGAQRALHIPDEARRDGPRVL